MKLLLDTHIWLWSGLKPKHLSPRVARALSDRRNELWLSPISLWEATILSHKRRIDLKPSVEVWIAKSLARVPMREAPLTYEVALAAAAISFPHRDPADAFLAATASVYGLTLVTADESMAQISGLSVLANL